MSWGWLISGAVKTTPLPALSSLHQPPAPLCPWPFCVPKASPSATSAPLILIPCDPGASCLLLRGLCDLWAIRQLRFPLQTLPNSICKSPSKQAGIPRFWVLGHGHGWWRLLVPLQGKSICVFSMLPQCLPSALGIGASVCHLPRLDAPKAPNLHPGMRPGFGKTSDAQEEESAAAGVGRALHGMAAGTSLHPGHCCRWSLYHC